MIDVAGEAAIGSKGEDDLRTNLTDSQYEITDSMRQVHAVELAVRIVENLAASNTKDLAGRGELHPTQRGEFIGRLRCAAIASRGSGRHADDESLDSTLVIEEQCAAEGSGLVVGMGSDAEKLAHK